MAIYIGSRYEGSDIVLVPDADENIHNAVFRTLPAGDLPRVGVYRVQEGDRLDRLADSVYGDPTLWWVIADANPEVGLPDPLVPGTILRIPDGRDIR